ncbi:CDP-diacylglycerol--serine O-phosphatidyltransferase [Candidatus Parabeggiatoa sp. HSG14]|uniref:CDP-diacylglycerol--serine O-phosphatidyltransferase n=1 Tax=Candidatus Parabeggiatoa sp. HSG14 TaxID=3055593 RepID=UPI0025A82916|nr:CDP-diacylglycerol--serine O-phosphatidyltransferase [Thiotrichales bacterium HSG14]
MTNEQNIPEKTKRRRGIYLLPNLFTTAALFSGFYAIVAAIQGLFEIAAIAIFIGMILDGLDGRVARMTNTESAFGTEYDSLSDLVCFGLAPSLLMYQWSLSSLRDVSIYLGKLGWLAAFIYTAATALRLARFNTQVGKVDKGYFQGLASPAAAGVMAGFVWIGTDYQIDGANIVWLAWFITVISGSLMVSKFRYHSFKDLDLKGRVPFVTILIMVMIFALVSIDPAQILFLVFFIYAISGPILTLVQLRKRKRRTIK